MHQMGNAPRDTEITIVWQSEPVSPETVKVVVAVPTFKRPDHLKATLLSVLGQVTSIPFAIVVMDNHPEGSEGAQAAQFVLEDYGIPATVILAHRRGNCAAYNAGFLTALNIYPDASHILVIDDDEIARPHWMETIAAVAQDTEAEFTGAPQHPVFERQEEQVWAGHSVFVPPYQESGTVPVIFSSGNVLISTERLRKHGYPWLDERFNFLGGGDSDFYARCKADGATFAWASEAGLDETTPSRRTELSWLNSRSLRNGSISALIQQRAALSFGDHAKRWAKSLLLMAASPYRSLILFLKTRSLTMALNPMNVALGRLLMEFGFANEQYRAAEKN